MSLAVPGHDMNRNFGFLISDLHRLITAAMDKELSALGLTRSQLRVVLHLTREEGLSQVQIADDLGMGKVTVGGLIDRLEVKGLVERRPHPTDRRAFRVFLTTKAARLNKPILRSGSYVTERMMANIQPKDQQRLIDLLLQVKENTQAIISDNSTNS